MFGSYFHEKYEFSGEDSDEERSYSDEINSDIENEMFSYIHHIQNSSEQDTPKEKNETPHFKNPKIFNFNGDETVETKPTVTTKHKTWNSGSNSENNSQEIIFVGEVINTKKRKSAKENRRQLSNATSKYSNLNDLSSEEELYQDSSDSSKERDVIINIQTGYRELKNSNKKLLQSVKQSMNRKCSPMQSGLTPIDFDDISTPYEKNSFNTPNSLPTAMPTPHQNLSSDLWRIDLEDKGSNKKMKRYFTPNCISQSRNQRFSNDRKNQDFLKCYLCGGNHTSTICVKVVCGTCFKVGHHSKHCLRQPYFRKCTLCNMHGHYKERCPDQWRRYHMTITPDVPLIKPASSSQPSNSKYCYNCGRKGHFGFECTTMKHRHLAPALSPYVFNYESVNLENSTTKNKIQGRHDRYHNDGNNERRDMPKVSQRYNRRQEQRDIPASATTSAGTSTPYKREKKRRYEHKDNDYDDSLNTPKFIWTGGKVRVVNLEDDGYFNQLNHK